MEETIIEALLQYGVLGLWTITLLVERYRSTKEFKQIIERNTEAFIRVYEIMDNCPKLTKK